MTQPEKNRKSEIAANLADVEERIASVCRTAGRDRGDITLIVITKTFPASDVDLLAELGVTDFGENRHPEAGDKHDEVASLLRWPNLRWHFVGGLQTNKANAVTRYADVIHSVDRLKLVTALERGAASADRTVTCLAQVRLSQIGLSDDAGRSGAAASDSMAIAEAIDGSAHLTLGGVMAVAPLGADPQAAFDELGGVARQVRQRFPNANIISAGMSGDLEQAVLAGATHLRIGRSVLGERPSLG